MMSVVICIRESKVSVVSGHLYQGDIGQCCHLYQSVVSCLIGGGGGGTVNLGHKWGTTMQICIYSVSSEI